jgi:Asp-tRNA(Asn)/Glu-tRNA(Gln) amidotransferase A subunit family amidase
MADLTQCTAIQLLGLYRSGEASPAEATQAVLQRIARLNPLLNAFCWVDEAAAMASARQSEARWQAYRRRGAGVLPFGKEIRSVAELMQWLLGAIAPQPLTGELV